MDSATSSNASTPTATDWATSQPETDLIMDETISMKPHWKLMGQKLGVPNYELTTIAMSEPDPAHCYMRVLNWAKAQYGVEFGWSNIVKALRSPSIGETTLADSISAKYGLTSKGLTGPDIPVRPKKLALKANGFASGSHTVGEGAPQYDSQESVVSVEEEPVRGQTQQREQTVQMVQMHQRRVGIRVAGGREINMPEMDIQDIERGTECLIAGNLRRCIAWIIDQVLLVIFISSFSNWGLFNILRNYGGIYGAAFQNMWKCEPPMCSEEDLFDAAHNYFYSLGVIVMSLLVTDLIVEPLVLGIFSTTVGKWTMGIYIWGYNGTPVLTNTVPGYSIRVMKQDPTYLQLLGRTTYKRILDRCFGIPINILYNYIRQERDGRTHHDRLSKTIAVRKLK